MANQGSHVLAQKLSITTLSPNDVRITEMKSALTALFKALTSIEQQVISLETTIHNSIEECRSRKIEHETELVDKESKIAVLRSEVEGLEDKIAAHENEASTIENGASELDERAADIRDTARRKRENAGLGAFISGLVGIALTPFTGGASLAIASAAAGLTAGINLSDASECEEHARRLRKRAREKRIKAESLRSERASLSCKMSSLKSDIKQLEDIAGKLGEAVDVLPEVTRCFLSSVGDIGNIQKVFQDMETVFTEASLHADSFKIIQSAFAVHQERLETRAQVYLDRLKEKWTEVEMILLQHGAKCIAD